MICVTQEYAIGLVRIGDNLNGVEACKGLLQLPVYEFNLNVGL